MRRPVRVMLLMAETPEGQAFRDALAGTGEGHELELLADPALLATRLIPWRHASRPAQPVLVVVAGPESAGPDVAGAAIQEVRRDPALSRIPFVRITDEAGGAPLGIECLAPATCTPPVIRWLLRFAAERTGRHAAELSARERVKELRTLHRATERLHRTDLPLEDRLHFVVNQIPPGMRWPGLTRARLRMPGLHLENPGFRATAWMHVAEFSLPNLERGRIEVVLLGLPPEAGPPFLPEEEELLRSLGGAIEGLLKQAHRESEAEGRALASEADLRQLQKMETVGQLAGAIAHDFNNVLTIIRSQADLTVHELSEVEDADADDGNGGIDGGIDGGAEGGEGGGDDDGRRKGAGRREMVELARKVSADLEVIRGAAERAGHLTGQLLAFSRKQPLEPREVSLAEVLSEAGLFTGRLLGENIRVVWEFAEGLPRIRVDPHQLEQVLLNLAINARDAMEGEGTLTLSAQAEGGEVVLTVADTGRGMTPEVQARAFEPFFTTKDPGRGTGMGLAQVYGTVRQSGGRIELESAPGEGTSVRLRFPAVA